MVSAFEIIIFLHKWKLNSILIVLLFIQTICLSSAQATLSFFKPLAWRIFPYLSNMVSDSRLWKIIQGSQSETAKCVFLMHNNSLYIIVESLNVSCIKLSIKVLNTTEEAVVSQSKQPFLKCPFVSANKFHFYPASSTSIMSNRS